MLGSSSCCRLSKVGTTSFPGPWLLLRKLKSCCTMSHLGPLRRGVWAALLRQLLRPPRAVCTRTVGCHSQVSHPESAPQTPFGASWPESIDSHSWVLFFKGLLCVCVGICLLRPHLVPASGRRITEPVLMELRSSKRAISPNLKLVFID